MEVDPLKPRRVDGDTKTVWFDGKWKKWTRKDIRKAMELEIRFIFVVQLKEKQKINYKRK